MFATIDWTSAELWIDLGSLVAASTLGTLAGGWFFGRLGGNRRRLHRANAIIARLQDLTANVASDVGQHSTRVQEISSALTTARDAGASALDELVLSSVAEILTANEQLSQQLASATVQLQRQAAEIESQALVARTDPLTNLSNRRAFDDELVRRLAEWQRRHIVVSLLMLDVDHFKRINDTQGHQAGDEVLRGLAAVLKNTMREMDLVARYGGEEFAVVLPVTYLHEAVQAAERARRAIAAHVALDAGVPLKVTASFGVTEVGLGDDAAAFVRRADEALYYSKQAGRDCVHFHDGQRCRPAAEISQIAEAGKPAAAASQSPQNISSAPAPDTSAAALPRGETVENPANQVRQRLANFSQSLDGQIEQSRSEGESISLLLVDVDNYRTLVEKLGASVGELVLQTMNDFLLAALSPRDSISPYGAGQFAVALPGSELSVALRIAEGVRAAIGGCSMQIKGAPSRFTISLGVAEAQADDDSSSLIKRADAALFASKAAGRNCTHFHNGETCEAAQAAANTA